MRVWWYRGLRRAHPGSTASISVLRQRMMLCACYAKSGTVIAYGTVLLRAFYAKCYAKSGTVIAYGGIRTHVVLVLRLRMMLCACYAKSGSALAYGDTVACGSETAYDDAVCGTALAWWCITHTMSGTELA
eukprot:3940469-Rhodomonas_salina.1